MMTVPIVKKSIERLRKAIKEKDNAGITITLAIIDRQLNRLQDEFDRLEGQNHLPAQPVVGCFLNPLPAIEIEPKVEHAYPCVNYDADQEDSE